MPVAAKEVLTTEGELMGQSTKTSNQVDDILLQEGQQLQERIKELKCLYGISKLVESSGGSLNKILDGTVKLIPVAWHHPSISCARIIANDKVFQTENFHETIWKLEAKVKEHGICVGRIEVCYLDKKPELYEGPFLQEERTLIDMIAERLGHILERIHSEERIESLARFTNENPNPVLRVSECGRILFSNNAAPMFLSALGCDETDILPESFCNSTKNALSKRKQITVEYDCQNGQTYSVTFAPVPEENYVNIYAQDVTERKIAERHIENYREKTLQAERLASLGIIGSAVAHQLNQPLSIIRLSIQKTLRDLDNIDCPDIVKELLNDSLYQVSHASSAVKGFLALGHSSSEKRLSNINIHEIAVKTATVFMQAANQRKIKLIVEKSLKKIPTFRGITSEIEQVFFILIQNAVQAASVDKWQRLKISSKLKKQHIQLKFSDDCGGVKPDILEEIFKPFYTTKPMEQGTGLGLSILKQILTSHNGTVRVDNKPGEGMSFFITLPIK